MDDLLSHLVKELVEKPDEVEVLTDESQNSSDITLIIDSNPDDVPLIIGRKGRTIKALRNIISILALKERRRVYIQVKHQKPREEGQVMQEEKQDAMDDEIPFIDEIKEEKPKKARESRRVTKPKAVKKEKSREAVETEDILGF